MVPALKNKLDAQPTVDRYTHLCSVCGLKNAHEWKCITWFIGLAIDFYKKNLISVRSLLYKLDENKHVSSAEVKEAIEKLNYIEQLGNEVVKNEPRSST